MFDPKRLLRWLCNHPRTSVSVVEDGSSFEPAVAPALHSIAPAMAIRWATAATEARRMIRDELPHLLIADCLLGMDESGLDLWRQCKEKVPGVPFLMMSGLSEATLRRMSRR